MSKLKTNPNLTTTSRAKCYACGGLPGPLQLNFFVRSGFFRDAGQLTEVVDLLLVAVEVEGQRELLVALVALERLLAAVQRQVSLQREVSVEVSVADLAPELLGAFGRARMSQDELALAGRLLGLR